MSKQPQPKLQPPSDWGSIKCARQISRTSGPVSIWVQVVTGAVRWWSLAALIGMTAINLNLPANKKI